MANVSSSNSQKALVPKLRFHDENGAEFPQLVPKTVGSLFSHISRRNADMKNNNVITNSAEYGLIPQRDFFDKDIAVEGNTDKYYIIGRDDFVYNPRKSTTAPYGPFNCYQGEEEGIVSPLYTCLKPLYPEMAEYLLWYFRSPAWHSYIYHNGAQGGARHDRVGMTNDLMDGIPVNIPCQSERKKISEFLTLLDKRLSAQRQLVDALKSYKRGVLEQLFSSNLSFSGSSQMANIVPLREVFCKISDRNSNGTVHNVVTNSAELGLLPQRDYFDKDIAVAENTQNYFVIIEGDFVYNPRKSKSAPYGPFNVYRSKETGIVSPLYTCLRSIADVNLDYLYWYFQSTAWHRYMYDNGSQGVRHDRVSMTDELLFAIPVVLPDKQLQDKIVAVMSSIQKLYEAEAAKSDCLQYEKAQFLRSLFA